jgi:hypothetical protein
MATVLGSRATTTRLANECCQDVLIDRQLRVE